MTQSTDITFEAGYRRLQDIAERLGSDEVPVHEMCDLFAEGKGLEQALGQYLSQQKERVEAIERGEGMRAFRVVPPGGAREEPAVNGAGGRAEGSGAAAANGTASANGAASAKDAAAANGAGTANGAASAGAERPDSEPPPPPQDEVLPF